MKGVEVEMSGPSFSDQLQEKKTGEKSCERAAKELSAVAETSGTFTFKG